MLVTREVDPLSLLETIQSRADGLAAQLEDLRVVSKIYPQDQAGFGPFYFWGRLPDEGTKLRVAASNACDQLQVLGWMVVSQFPKDMQGRFTRHVEGIQLVIRQENTAIPYTSVGAAFDAARAHILGIVKLATFQDSDKSDVPLLVPDTNALLFNPRLETWSFGGLPVFSLILVPAVMKELDDLKNRKQNAGVSEKAEKIVSFLKECRRRGGLQDPVTVLKGRSNLKAVAYDPPFDDFPTWLNPANSDDRILVSVLDLQRREIRQQVLLVTSVKRQEFLRSKATGTFAHPPSGDLVVVA